jgi:hypothetical protein
VPYKDPEKRRAKNQEYARKRRMADPEFIRERNTAYCRRWLEKHPEYTRSYYAKNSAQMRQSTARWVKDNPEWSAFVHQRKGAKKRKIAFLFTFDEWWTVWRDSGKWEQRGKHKGQYVMARYGDIGPYATDNVRIATVQENNADAARRRAK